MNIAIDGKRYFLNTSGLGRYSRTLIHYLISDETEKELHITLFKPAGKVGFEAFEHPRLKIATAKHTPIGDLGNALWRFYKLPKIIDRGPFSLFHGPSHVLPKKSRCPMVVTMLDLIFLRYPQYFRLWDRNYYRHVFKKSAERADHIISISQATKADLINYMGIQEEKISVIYPAFDDVFKTLAPSELEDIRDTYTLPKQYILYVGTIEPRKNILRTAKAFDVLQSSNQIAKEVQFLIVGGKGWFYDDIINGISELPNKKNIRMLGPIMGKALAGIYQMATVMAYPSEFEGFGYPVLESLQQGTPVLTSKISSLPEAGGNAAHFVDPYSIDDIAVGLEKIINDNDYRKSLILKGFEHAKKFSGKKMAQQTIGIYKRVARTI